METNNSQKRVAVLVEKHFDETEYVFFNAMFPHHNIAVDYLSYLWDQPELTFDGNDFKEKIVVNKCISKISPADYQGVILIGGYAMDRLRYEESRAGKHNESEGVKFLQKCHQVENLKIGTICHSLWLFCAAPILLKGKKVTCAQNIVDDVINAGGDVQFDSKGRTLPLVVDGNLISGKHPESVALFTEAFINLI